MLRWFHSYVAKNGMGALEAYDAYAARVRAQRVKAHASVRRRGEAAPAPAKKSGDETNGTKKTPTTTTSAERATMSERLMPNELSAMDEMARDDANEGANEGDESFEFAAPAAEGRQDASIASTALRNTSGVVQVNQTAGTGNVVSNVFVLRPPAGTFFSLAILNRVPDASQPDRICRAGAADSVACQSLDSVH